MMMRSIPGHILILCSDCRAYIWKHMLRLPENYDCYNALVLKVHVDPIIDGDHSSFAIYRILMPEFVLLSSLGSPQCICPNPSNIPHQEPQIAPNIAKV